MPYNSPFANAQIDFSRLGKIADSYYDAKEGAMKRGAFTEDRAHQAQQRAQAQQVEAAQREALRKAFVNGQFNPEVAAENLARMGYLGPAKDLYSMAGDRAKAQQGDVKEVGGRLVRVAPGNMSASEIYAPKPGAGNFNKDQANIEEGLRKEFATLGKPYFEVRDAFSRVEQSAAQPSAAGDLALIFNYMKMLDPGSVVREGEFATAQSAAGVPDRVWNMYNRMLKGERLNPAQRGDFINQARGLFQRQEEQYQGIQKQYRGISERTGVNPENTIVDFGRPSPGIPKLQDRLPQGGQQMPQPQGAVQSPPSAMPPRAGAQGQIPPAAVQFLRGNPSPEIIQQFEMKYGPGSAQQFLRR